MALQGKGFFTWKIPRCEAGNPGAIAAAAQSANLTHVVIKVADGPGAYHGEFGNSTDMNTAVMQVLRDNQIGVWGWHYIYGENPSSEARIAIQRIRQYNLDGYVIDAEAEYKKPGRKDAARRFMSELRSALPDVPVALSSYRYPSLHPQIPWTEFLSKCTLVMPQVYWMQAHNPGAQLTKTVREYQARTSLPLIPTGAAFCEHNWQPSVAEVQEFLQTAQALNLSAANFWEWGDVRSGILPGVWEAIRDVAWGALPADSRDIAERFVEALNTRNVEQILSLYTSTAVHVTSLRTVSGHEALRAWYNGLFNNTLPGAQFTLTGFSGRGSSRHFTWTAEASNGLRVLNGNDTLGMLGDKIVYHYNFFTTTHV